jgi:hypothetical protein
MPRHLARAMYDQLEDTVTSVTMQLRSAIQADAGMPARVNGRGNEAIGRLRRSSGWARQVSAESNGTRNSGTTLTVSLPMSRAL